MKKKPNTTKTQTDLFLSDTDLSPIKKRLIDSSHDIAMNDAEGITYQHSVLCQVSLPYKNPGDSIRNWDRKQGNAVIALEAGRILNPTTNEFNNIGLPYGTKSRLILTHLNSEALKTGSPIIDVESSLTAFVKRLGIDGNGRDIRDIKGHLSRLSVTTIRLGFLLEGDHTLQVNTQLVKALDIWFEKNERQRVLWPSTIQLSDEYFNSLTKHAVPLDERALAALSHSPMGLDVYSWLAQRLHRISSKQQFITWAALKDQFGYNYNRMIDFKMAFREILIMVHSQYPDAKFDIDDTGMTLKNSPPPIGKRQFLVT